MRRWIITSIRFTRRGWSSLWRSLLLRRYSMANNRYWFPRGVKLIVCWIYSARSHAVKLLRSWGSSIKAVFSVSRLSVATSCSSRLPSTSGYRRGRPWAIDPSTPNAKATKRRMRRTRNLVEKHLWRIVWWMRRLIMEIRRGGGCLFEMLIYWFSDLWLRLDKTSEIVSVELDE